jgi:CelD/BcsL family acetyltransferase involved in cellulose biosynthesis
VPRTASRGTGVAVFTAMTVEVVRAGASLQSAAQEWRTLQQRIAGDNPFLSHAWLTQWMLHFGGEAHRVLLQRHAGSLCGALAVDLDGDVAHSLGDHTYWSGPLASDDASLREMCDALDELGVRSIELRMHQDAAELLDRAIGDRYVAVAKDLNASHAIAVAPTLEGYLATRAAKVRAELSRKLRKLERERPGVALRCWSRAPFGGEAFELVSGVEAASWKRDEGTAIVCSERETAFYRDLMGLDTPEFQPRLYALVDGADTLAYTLGIAHRRSFYALKTSYPLVHGPLSPGAVLFCKLIEALGSEGELDRVEFLGQDARFKREMASETRHHCTFHVERRTLASRSQALLYHHVRPGLLTLARQHPVGDRALGWLRAMRDQRLAPQRTAADQKNSS